LQHRFVQILGHVEVHAVRVLCCLSEGSLTMHAAGMPCAEQDLARISLTYL